nr:hypothetical protein [Arcicella sp.]
FESLKEVRDFMIDFQLSRRNITPQQASYLRGIRYNTEKKEVSDNLKTISDDTILPNGQNVHLAKSDDNLAKLEAKSDDNLPNGQNVHLANKLNKTTAQELGEYFNVDEKTIRRDAEFARGLEKLDPSFRKDILNGKIKIEKSKIQKISKATDIQQPLKSPEELNFVYEALTSDESKIAVSQTPNILQKKYLLLNTKLQKVYQAKKIKSTELEALKTAFQDFIDAL